ncbi:hypothetical protein R5R35_011098 [Gryllus longicercus]|uniref:Odorant binding protein n=1 Tax=Gryllus longicercus TaxID=2509291 RepID=A0AAN9WB84_9ORTH
MNTILPALLLASAAFVVVECGCKGGKGGKGFKECAQEAGITKEQWKEMKTQKTVPDSEEAKKLMCCVLKKRQMLKEDGESNPEVCKQHIDSAKEKLEKAGMQPEELKTCCDQGGADCPERAYNLLKCVQEKTKLPFVALLFAGGKGHRGKGSKEEE